MIIRLSGYTGTPQSFLSKQFDFNNCDSLKISYFLHWREEFWKVIAPFYNVTGQIVCREDILLHGKGEGGVTDMSLLLDLTG